MRVLQVVIGYHPARAEFGGIVETVEHLSNEIAARGHEVEVWTTGLVGRGRSLAAEDVVAKRGAVTLRYFHTYHSARIGFGFAFSPSFSRAIEARAREFDVIHINGYRNHLALSAALAARRNGVPYILQPHGTTPPIVHRVGAKKLFDRLLGRAVMRDAARLLAISRSETEQFRGHGVDPADVEVVYNGIDVGMVGQDLGDGGWFRDELGYDESEVILYLGRIHDRKGLLPLVEAFELLAPRRPEARLVIIGADDGFQHTLEDRIAQSPVRDRMSIEGPRYGMAKYRAYSGAALVAYPAIYEYFGLVPFEGLLCGTPAVVTAGEGCAEVIEMVEGGWTAPYGDTEALAATIEGALDERRRDPAAWQARVDEAQRRILERFTWSAVADHLLGVYDQARANGDKGTHS